MQFCLDNSKLRVGLDEYFPEKVDSYLNMYMNHLKNLGISSKIISNIDEYRKNIHMCLVEYYYGQHGSARRFFDAAMKFVPVRDLCNQVLEDKFYRARRKKKEDSMHQDGFTKEEMFHIPLDKRHLVATERYSFPGVPCLYLGTSKEICYAELGGEIENVYVAEIIRKKELDIIDLSFFDKYDINQMDSSEIEKIYKLWPIIASCSFYYENSNDMNFRPDYIIPQFLLEYIIDTNCEIKLGGIENEVRGIRYRSIKKQFFDEEQKCFNDDYVNYVFPVLSNKTSGHSADLLEQFEVVSVELECKSR